MNARNSSANRKLSRQPSRARVAAAFRRAANGVGRVVAFARTKRFFRAGGGSWAQVLA